MHRGLRVAPVVVATAGLLAACGGGSTGNSPGPSAASPASTGVQSSAAASTDSGEAPRIPSPLPTAGLTTDPCSALSASQLNELGIAPRGQASSNQAGPNCKWNGAANPSNTVAIGVLTANQNGLNDIYAGNSQKKFAYFETTQVDGYPGVYADSTDDRANGFCSLSIGITDQLAIDVSVVLLTGSNKTHPCDSASAVGKAAIEHLKGAA
ncbi:DUF3558 domain-containing protein [Amycolatopsis taiwanensis]|uniref:DUF3558 domain-containing protein n=1 Tax=Amycolatopsis taiwanensis TaxID=342230 RepID=A0A9W6VG71_9PSEU|nr:DUF3558 domain-containing protein [Amycolatopsis taiwanensis]GLY67490.1 hypothetical protein Atai01_41090 [Amycolatopsis taiwanensis]